MVKKVRHLLTLADLSAAEMERIFSIAEDLKSKWAKGIREPLLPGRVMALLFEKPSLRTRVSFEACMAHLGGSSLFLGQETGFGTRETMADFARVLSQYVDVIVARTYRHQTVVELAQYAQCPVINGLSDLAHPCQALADLFTIRELFGRLRGLTLAWIGDGNNVARSLARGCGKLGIRMVMATPPPYRFDEAFLEELRRDAPEFELVVTDDPVEAVQDAAVIYTDVWTSMGQEAEAAQRRRIFAPYQVNAALMAHAQKGAVFMHCMPAHRGEEVTDEVIDGPQSVVIQQAANRMHLQKGLLAWLLAAQN
ncbi:MAG: ornithine carbamoyltransferase [Thermoguttaceae bacterium]|nr:ornithine carbamoyltransferase [Thermoguttaceae bacterium]MDW8039561.1 ornithine carbamoyltransferase [Thermoguttaceae bacterium]